MKYIFTGLQNACVFGKDRYRYSSGHCKQTGVKSKYSGITVIDVPIAIAQTATNNLIVRFDPTMAR